MIGEHGLQLGLVLRLQQLFHGAGGQLGERLIRRREDRERAIALQRLDQARRLDGRDQRLERTRRNGDIDDVLLRLFGLVALLGPGAARQREDRSQGHERSHGTLEH